MKPPIPIRHLAPQEDGGMSTLRPASAVEAQRRSANGSLEYRKPRVSDDGPVCTVEPYPRVTAGDYLMRCIEAKPYRDPGFNRHVCRLAFSSPLVHEGITIYAFMNLGNGKRCPGRRSRYWKAWTMANGNPPRRGQKMTPRVFMHKWFKVSVRDVTHDADQKPHGAAAVYSKVHAILELDHA